MGNDLSNNPFVKDSRECYITLEEYDVKVERCGFGIKISQKSKCNHTEDDEILLSEKEILPLIEKIKHVCSIGEK